MNPILVLVRKDVTLFLKDRASLVLTFVVPFVPISGTPLESHPAPGAEFMHAILKPLSSMLVEAGLKAADIKAGCGRCGACSSLSTYERSVA